MSRITLPQRITDELYEADRVIDEIFNYDRITNIFSQDPKYILE